MPVNRAAVDVSNQDLISRSFGPVGVASNVFDATKGAIGSTDVPTRHFRYKSAVMSNLDSNKANLDDPMAPNPAFDAVHNPLRGTRLPPIGRVGEPEKPSLNSPASSPPAALKLAVQQVPRAGVRFGNFPRMDSVSRFDPSVRAPSRGYHFKACRVAIANGKITAKQFLHNMETALAKRAGELNQEVQRTLNLHWRLQWLHFAPPTRENTSAINGLIRQIKESKAAQASHALFMHHLSAGIADGRRQIAAGLV